MNELKLTGGARIGNAKATAPFVSLTVNQFQLELNASIAGNLVFRPEDIISVEAYAKMLGKGIKINHQVSAYPAEVIFWSTKKPAFVLDEIAKTGFLEKSEPIPEALSKEILLRQSQGSFPLKKQVAIGMLVVWNALFAIDFIIFFLKSGEGKFPGLGVFTALVILFATALLTLLSERFREIVLKKGRTFDDIKKGAFFILLVSGVILSSFVAQMILT